MLDANDEAPIIRWVNALMFQAAKEGASDIHIRARREGHHRPLPGRRRAARSQARAEEVPALDHRAREDHGRPQHRREAPAAERPHPPQDGRPDVDMRVETAPTADGESITIRLLDRSSVLLGLADIGFADDHLEQIRGIIARPHGILLVTGPTGSGKTTTLYACLSEINSPDINILTVEDPVEYQLEGISQTQVNPKIDLTFATGLRSFLRQDPDVIMVGEIRDRETAEVAITASLTGHLVLSTVHTNDAAGGITRLVDMGIEPFLVASLARRPARAAPRAPPCYKCARAGAAVGRDPRRARPRSSRRSSRGGYHFPDVKGMHPPPVGHGVRARRLPRVQRARLSRPNRHLRAAHDQRTGSPARAREGRRRIDPQRGGRARAWSRCASMARARSCSG